MAVTDHEAVCNAVKVQKIYKKVKKDHPDFKVILGNEIYLCRNGLNANNFNREYDRYWHFVLLAKDASVISRFERFLPEHGVVVIWLEVCVEFLLITRT